MWKFSVNPVLVDLIQSLPEADRRCCHRREIEGNNVCFVYINFNTFSHIPECRRKLEKLCRHITYGNSEIEWGPYNNEGKLLSSYKFIRRLLYSRDIYMLIFHKLRQISFSTRWWYTSSRIYWLYPDLFKKCAFG